MQTGGAREVDLDCNKFVDKECLGHHNVKNRRETFI